MKGSFIASNFPLIAFVTLFIYPFIMGIILCAENKRFQNSGYAIACEILSILGFGFLFVTFIMGFFLKECKPTSSQQ